MEVLTTSNIPAAPLVTQPFTFVDPDQGGTDSASARRVIRSRAAAHSHHHGPRQKPRKRRRDHELLAMSFRTLEPGSVDRSTVANIGKKRSEPPEKDCHLPPHNNSSPPYMPYGPQTLSAGRLDPSNIFPVESQSWFPWVLDYLYDYLIPQGLSNVGIGPEDSREWSRSITHLAMTEPALFYCQLFVASGPLIRDGRMSPTTELWLRDRTVVALNENLSDPSRALSTATILVVGRIAFHECVYGDKEAARKVHRPALEFMIAKRGGLEALRLTAVHNKLHSMSMAIMSMILDPPTGEPVTGAQMSSPTSKREDDVDGVRVFEAMKLYLPEGG